MTVTGGDDEDMAKQGGPGRPKKSDGPAMGVVQFRLPDELLARLDAYAEDMGKIMLPGLVFNRTDAVRQLLTAGLEAWETKKRERGAGKK